jgi:chromosome segregation ATPase
MSQVKSRIYRDLNQYLEDLEDHVKRKEDEKQRLDEEIEHKRAILKSANVEIETIDKHNQLEAELRKYHLFSKDPQRLLTVLNNIKNYRYDPRKYWRDSPISNP